MRAIVPWSQPGGETLLLTSGDDGAVRVWDPTTGRPASEALAAGGPPLLSLVSISVNGHSLLAAGGPRGIRLWDLETGIWVDPVADESGRSVRVLTVLPMPDGLVLLAGADAGGAVWLWRVHADRLTVEASAVLQHRAQALAAFPRADGRTELITVGYDGYLRLWDPVAGREVTSVPLQRGAGHLVNGVTV